MDAGEVHVDPVHDEFFKMQDLADALVREAVQNSLDARRTRLRMPVRVRFKLATGDQALSAEGARQYFGALREHLEAASIRSVLPEENEDVPYLLVEDFGTRGLTGDPAIDPELEDAGTAKNDFFYFWRNVGRSNKGEVDRGRWGLGKAVFPVASRIRTIFGLTRRADDSRALLLGQSVLKTHIINGERIYPYGFFARYDKRKMPLPIEDAILLERFNDDFSLRRTEPGLSVVIPYFREEELSFERIIRSAAAQYFYPITRGDLIVDVEDGVRHESLSARTIDDVGSRFAEGEGIAKLAELTRWSIAEGTEGRVELDGGAVERAPRWSEDILPEDTLRDLRDRFERGQPVAVRAPLLVKRKRMKAASSFFDVILLKDESLRKPDLHFIRRGITIPDVKSTTDRPVRALVVVDQEALSTFLGDAENPAHSDWSERADKLRLTYDHHAATLRFVKNSAGFLASLLNRPPEGRVRNFLRDIFSIETSAEEEPSSAGARIPLRNRQGDSEILGNGVETVGGPRLTVARVTGGFTVKGTGDAWLVGRPFSVEMAYRARNGNPFRKHSPFDFDVRDSDISVAAEGAQVVATGANGCRFVPRSPKFQITMKGFDVRRDLLVRVVDQTDAAEAELH